MSGKQDAGPRIALLVARFNSMITGHLERAARERLLREGIAEDRIESFHVPGAWDLPQAAQWILSEGRHDALIAIGCVIRGETAHFDYVAGHASDGLGRVALHKDTPIVFGVLTADNAEQALARALPSGANKGAEFAESALSLVALRDAVWELDEP
ncbi:MAG: 6,7-dimethyl-8-ribityllumazine synthase [Gemmatimonadetes bacterium]|nr:6,7-dimethyl-8-ribityllumazine synthase [Gemmatimonadota bacterium]